MFLCTSFTGNPKCDEKEMSLASFIDLDELLENQDKMFKPFLASLEMIVEHNKKLDSTSLTKEKNKRTISSTELDFGRKDDDIPEDKLDFFTAENGKVVAYNQATGETSGLGPEIDKSSEGSKSSNLNKKKLASLRKRTLNKNRKVLKLSSEDYHKVTSEISTYYKDNYESRVGKVCGVYKGEKFYLFENYGFDSYRIFASFKYRGNEDVIKLIQEELKNGNIK